MLKKKNKVTHTHFTTVLIHRLGGWKIWWSKFSHARWRRKPRYDSIGESITGSISLTDSSQLVLDLQRCLHRLLLKSRLCPFNLHASFSKDWIVIDFRVGGGDCGDQDQRVCLPIHSSIKIIYSLKLVSLSWKEYPSLKETTGQCTFWVLKKGERSGLLCKSGSHNRDALLPLG